MTQFPAFAAVSRSFGYLRGMRIKDKTLHVPHPRARISLDQSFFKSVFSGVQLYAYFVMVSIARLFKMRASNRFMGSAYLAQQTTGLLPYIQDGKVDVVFIGAGSNDFFYHTNDFSVSGAFKPKKKVEISQDFIDAVAGSLIASLDIVLQAGADKAVLALVPAFEWAVDTGEKLAAWAVDSG